MASIVLLPLLGVTWVFGLLSVSRSTRVFAYIFTVLNSLQVPVSFKMWYIKQSKIPMSYE